MARPVEFYSGWADRKLQSRVAEIKRDCNKQAHLWDSQKEFNEWCEQRMARILEIFSRTISVGEK